MDAMCLVFLFWFIMSLRFRISHKYCMFNLSYMAQMVKNVPAMQENCVRSLGGEDSLEKGMATHSSILVCRIPWTEEPGRLYSPWGCKESVKTEKLTLSLFIVHLII